MKKKQSDIKVQPTIQGMYKALVAALSEIENLKLEIKHIATIIENEK